MSLYALIGYDREGSLEQRLRVRQEHLGRVRGLADEGRLIVAGPFPVVDADEPTPGGFSGSLIVAEFESLETAREWFEQDPYVSSGVFARIDVRPFMQVLP
jgi:uncharacterized protein YciI